jgi:hypothetical protein
MASPKNTSIPKNQKKNAYLKDQKNTKMEEIIARKIAEAYRTNLNLSTELICFHSPLMSFSSVDHDCEECCYHQ